MDLQRTKAIAKKEFKHLLRDYRMLAILILFPVFLLIIFGYAINFDVKNIKIAVYDRDHSSLSRKFINSLSGTENFDLEGYIFNDSDIKHVLDEKKAQCVIVIPDDFSENVYNNVPAKIQFLIDGVDGNTATIVQNYVNLAALNFNREITAEIFSAYGIKSSIPLELEPIFWFNPELSSTKFLLPGLIGMILVIVCVVSVSISLVREKERGTIEQINVSPIKSTELLLGKITPYVALALLNATMIIIAGYILFGIEVKGSFLLLFFSSLIFLFSAASIGIFISVISESMQVAFSLATALSLLPSVILSGFIFPIESMPWIIQVFTNITPVKFFIVILRAIILRGVGLEAFWEQVIYMLLFAIIILTLANLINIKKEKSA
ncbi:MAG: ABC transporter permease [Ignavibacteria bacterium]|nr:ABC transporter permease [Ignavibacteria bacterium]